MMNGEVLGDDPKCWVGRNTSHGLTQQEPAPTQGGFLWISFCYACFPFTCWCLRRESLRVPPLMVWASSFPWPLLVWPLGCYHSPIALSISQAGHHLLHLRINVVALVALFFPGGLRGDQRGNNYYFHSRGLHDAHLICGCCPWESQRPEAQPSSQSPCCFLWATLSGCPSWIRSGLSSDSPRGPGVLLLLGSPFFVEGVSFVLFLLHILCS